MPKDIPLTPVEKIQLRLRCAEVALVAASRVDITKDEGLSFAERLWAFAVKTPKGSDEALS